MAAAPLTRAEQLPRDLPVPTAKVVTLIILALMPEQLDEVTLIDFEATAPVAGYHRRQFDLHA